MDLIQVLKEDAGKRLDKFLTEKMAGITRSQIQKKIQAGDVTVNGKKVEVHKFLKENDEISVGAGAVSAQSQTDFPPPTKGHPLSIPPFAKGSLSTFPPLTKGSLSTFPPLTKGGVGGVFEPKIIFEDEDFLVINKPSGLLVHPTARLEKNTLVDWLLKKYPEIKNVGGENYREGIIHRLDKEVSGVMLVAKTKKGYARLKQQFKDRKITKKYLALVYGVPGEHEGKIDLPIGRNAEGKFVAHPRVDNLKYKDNDKHAITLYHLKDTIRDYALLEVQILTGRSHQIRAHLSAIGHPIVGDKEYGPINKPFLKKFSKKIKVLEAPRIFLHSNTIGFKNLKNEWVEFISPLPLELTKFIDTLKK